MAHKVCKCCGQSKSLRCFYKHLTNKDRRDSYCKRCRIQDMRESRELKAEYYRAYDRARALTDGPRAQRRAYLLTEAGKQAHKRATTAWRVCHPEKYAAIVHARNTRMQAKRLMARWARRAVAVSEPCLHDSVPAQFQLLEAAGQGAPCEAGHPDTCIPEGSPQVASGR